MAKQKSAKKAAPAAKKKSSAAKPKRKSTPARRKQVPVALSIDEKQRLLKPLTNFDDLIERLVATWRSHGSKIKVPGLTPARLASLLRKAESASRREETVRAALEAKLQPLANARLRSEHDAWKSALDLYAMVKTAARTDPALAAPFDFFAEALARRRRGTPKGAPEGEDGATP